MEDFVPNLTGTVKKTVGEREKLNLLRGQMDEMSNDYETMRKAREEAKRQLDARFQDVYQKIQGTRDYVAEEGRRVNELLKNFQNNFQEELKVLKEFTIKSFEEEKALREKQDEIDNKRMDGLEKMIEDERQERLKQTEDLLKPIRTGLENLETAFETERTTRIERETEILDKLAEESQQMNERMDQERADRIKRLQDLRDSLYNDINTQNSHIEKFQQNSLVALTDMKNGAEEEMRSRLDHQDDILDNLSNFIKTFQDTLKIIGKDV
ncbi:unnamed protein product [Blepharisma stoltei]|uniref:SF-assemblin n=1 Tax=Blepharisma stoltei TaxID=1481888 RepID=A0AAU9IE66_9CILI|nr:unnamed protein product [Blepharisma stoltei]